MIPIPAFLIKWAGETLAKVIVWGLAILLAIGLLFGVYHAVKNYFTADLTARVKVISDQAQAQGESGHDAVDVTGNVADNQAAGVVVGQENDNVIDHTSGAAATIDPALRAAGLQSLCARASYRSTHPACVQRAAP